MIKIHINCFGDSVTEGMAVIGHHTADYGAYTYPAQLNKILKDSGYDAEVKNYGHGGERIAEVAVRCGGAACYTTEDLIIPGNGKSVSLGKRLVQENGKETGTKLKIFNGASSEDDLNVYFTQMSHDTNPITIDGQDYYMNVINNEENVISQLNPDKVDFFAPKGSLLVTANNKNADVNIFYVGINDRESLTLKVFIELMQKCATANGGKYIILGSTHALWEKWSDINGDNLQKYEKYKRECYKAFGIHFIDMYDEFSRHGVDMSLQAGYFTDKNEDEIYDMRDKLKNHIIPKEFVYDGKSEGDVHLSKEGYYVMAKLVYNRMKLLSYLE